MKSPGPRKKSTPEERLQRIRKQIIELGPVCSGTLVHRTKVCGNPSCACATDPEARHGPYYQWRRWEKARRVDMSLPDSAAPGMARAIRNHRRLRRLIRLWERESVRVLLEEAKRKSP
jgi:hypothetical protein